ncbi:MAG: GIY-YIG nuclease family protein [Bacteroidetes bacterium]|nr:GIY-YIG nuclease family protein [Bacteroidota bacterium]MBS1974926.1 GIY-YIG nuclease family protein [Bacteroidota bacterium]
MYAIVDIETTGGYAVNNAITEIAIVLHDGEHEFKRFETLVNPGMPIPRYVQVLTGITDDTIKEAPYFDEIAYEVFSMLQGNVFVAHNVNFDYSFLHHQFKKLGFLLNCKKLCTVRLGRKVFPGLPSYSLGNFCRSLEIDITNRHRAGGDAVATSLLFKKILDNDKSGYVESMLKGRNREQYLPPNLPAEQLEQLPQLPGVYYFHDQNGKVIYVGKARNLLRRVASHFSNNKPNKQKQEFLHNIYSVSYQECGTELMAYLFECIEIKRLWPKYNRSLKRFEQTYGLYLFEDMNGYLRLAIEKKKKHLKPVYTFSLLLEGQNILRKMAAEFHLCPKLCFIQLNEGKCEGIKTGECFGACEQEENAKSYNERVELAIGSLQNALPTFTLIDDGRNINEQSCILVENGKFYGMGYLSTDTTITNKEELKGCLTQYPENDYMRGLIYHHAEKWPNKKVNIV